MVLINGRMIVSTYLPSLYIPDRPFTLPSAPIRYSAVEGGHTGQKKVDGAELITSPNYVTGLSAALLSKVRTSVTLQTLPLSHSLHICMSDKDIADLIS
jgi:hypothetical protein